MALVDFFLSFGQWPIIICVLIGMGFANKKVLLQCVCLCTISMIINVALKGTFKVPLSPTLHKIGYAFPSGHMQLATVLYVWIAIHLSSWFWRGLIGCILLGMGFGLHYHHYHTYVEILGGLFTGLLLIGLYQLNLLYLSRHSEKLLLILSTLLMGYNVYLYLTLPLHAWVAYLVLFIILAMQLLLKKFARSSHQFTI